MTLRDSLSRQAYGEAMVAKYKHQQAQPPTQAGAGEAVWKPFPGTPQEQAYLSEADEIFYGGAAGGGKTDLLLGVASTQHQQSIIFRRVFPSIRGIIERSREIFNQNKQTHAKDSYNESLHIWRLSDGPVIEFGSMQYEKDKENYRGRPHDFYGWDEVTEFAESQFRFTNAWNRSTQPGQRCRIIATGNPPTNTAGQWVIQYWSPWLDEHHPSPAQPGELRWFARIGDRDVEVESGESFEREGETIYPRSRTFIPALLKDNPVLEASGYRSVIQGLPEPLRSQLLYGDFGVGLTDDPYQTIPTEWVRQAIERWKSTSKPDIFQTALGVDVAYGGRDQTVIAERYGYWVAPMKKYPGKSTPSGNATATLVIAAVNGNPIVNIDNLAWGAAAFEHLQERVQTRGVKFGDGSSGTDKTGRLRFANIRAEAYWKLREILDPESGYNVCLPDDREMFSDLTAVKWELRSGRIYMCPKEEIKDVIGRSPDCGDAIALAFYGYEPLPVGTFSNSNPKTPSRFTSGVTGGRWQRGQRG